MILFSNARILWGLGLLIGLIVGSGTPLKAGIFNPETFTLANGMQVVVVSNRRAPVVTHMVWYKAGAADEPAGKSGVAHLLEHLMFKGTKRFPAGEFSRILARHGGRENAFTSPDYTGYYQTVAVDRLEMVMEMEADRMTNLVLDAGQMETERKVVIEERRSRTDNNPSGILREQVQAASYLNHPYGRPIIGWEHEIRGLTLADLRAYYERWYRPANAVLVVAGDITAAKLRPLAEKYYGAIPARPPVERVWPQEPPQKAARRIELKDPRVREPSWSRAFLAPSYSTGATEHAYPLEVLAQILGGGATSRLYRRLVVEKQLMVSAGAGYSANNLGPSQFIFYGMPKPGNGIEAAEQAMEEEIAVLLTDGVTTEEVARAKRILEADAIYARDSARAGAQALGAALAMGRTVEDVEAWPERIAAVTAEQVNAAARAVFRIRRSVTAVLLPGKEE